MDTLIYKNSRNAYGEEKLALQFTQNEENGIEVIY